MDNAADILQGYMVVLKAFSEYCRKHGVILSYGRSSQDVNDSLYFEPCDGGADAYCLVGRLNCVSKHIRVIVTDDFLVLRRPGVFGGDVFVCCLADPECFGEALDVLKWVVDWSRL